MTESEEDMPESTASFLLEGDEPGLPLIISFGFYSVDNNPLFDFYGRLKKVALVSGRRANRLYLRDLQQLWYLRGISGLGDSVDATVAELRPIIDRLAPSSVTTIGQSMGAYAAILYGILLGVDKIIAFGPLSCFDAPRWELMSERRWDAIRQRLAASDGGSVAPYDDLPGLLRNRSGKRPAIDLLYGVAPGTMVVDGIGHDVAHAMRFEGIDNVTLLPVPAGGHAIVEYFRKNGVITDVILNRLYGTPLNERIAALHGSTPWVNWLEENLSLGVTEQQLIDTMRAQPGMDDTTIRDLIDRVHVIRALKIIAAQPAPQPVLMKAPYDPDEEEAPCCSDPRHQHR